MKTLYLLLFLILTGSMMAQPNSCRHQEQIKAQKIAYLTNKLDLSVQEAQTFWPIYNEFEKKKDELFDAEKTIAQKMMKAENLTDKEKSDLADKYIDVQQAEAKLLADYHLKFKKVLTIQKVMILYTSDRMFKRELLKQLRNCPAQKEE